MSDVTRYPLSWPTGWKRRASDDRRYTRFSRKESKQQTWSDGKTSTWLVSRKMTVYEAIRRLRLELDRLGVEDFLLSTNVPQRLDGLPYSNAAEPKDPGAAVYFKIGGRDRCLACDGYDTVAGNIAALAKHVEALRAIQRHGVGTLDQAFAGYTGLPAAAGVEWWIVLGVPKYAALDVCEQAFRRLARTAHPDRGGNGTEQARLGEAIAAARAHFSAPEPGNMGTM